MPIEDRNYYREESSYVGSFGGSGGFGGGGSRSVVVTLIIINVVIFAIDAFTAQTGERGPNWLSWFMSLKTQSPDFAGPSLPFYHLFPWNLWQIFTYGFAHASISSQSTIFHILFNMLILFFLGRPVEQHYGSQEFLKFYLGALFFSGVVSLIYHLALGNSASLVGASGAVTAVVMLFVFNFPRQTLLIWGVLPAPAWVIGVIVIVGDVMTAFSAESKIGWYAHLAGAAFAAFYFKLGWNFRWLKTEWFTRWFSSKPKLKVHREHAAEESLKTKADLVLDKISREGEASLTRKERKILEKYSKQVRQHRD